MHSSGILMVNFFFFSNRSCKHYFCLFFWLNFLKKKILSFFILAIVNEFVLATGREIHSGCIENVPVKFKRKFPEVFKRQKIFLNNNRFYSVNGLEKVL